MKTPEYIILTPIAPGKLYSLNRFLKNVISFEPRPREMVFCAEPEIVPQLSGWEQRLKKQGIKLVIFTLEPEIINKYPNLSIEKISYSREYLRHYFINSQFEWALWLDSDIIPKSNIAKTLLKMAYSEKFLAITNQYPGKEKNSHWSGIGCTLTCKTACALSRFWIAPIIWKGKRIGNISEDYCFLAMLDAGARALKNRVGMEEWKGRKVGKFVSVYHEIKPGVTRFLKKDIKSGGLGNPYFPSYSE